MPGLPKAPTTEKVEPLSANRQTKYALEVRERAVRVLLEHERYPATCWAAVVSISAKVGCAAQTLYEWVKKAEVDASS